MQNKLNFDNNWRRTLLLTNQTDRNIDRPVPYIKLDNAKLPCSFKKFCEQFSYDYNFDYDLDSRLIWPVSDSANIQHLADNLNRTFSKVASIITKSPSSAHNLQFDDLEDSLSF